MVGPEGLARLFVFNGLGYLWDTFGSNKINGLQSRCPTLPIKICEIRHCFLGQCHPVNAACVDF
jgi:hypothetical protein